MLIVFCCCVLCGNVFVFAFMFCGFDLVCVSPGCFFCVSVLCVCLFVRDFVYMFVFVLCLFYVVLFFVVCCYLSMFVWFAFACLFVCLC